MSIQIQKVLLTIPSGSNQASERFTPNTAINGSIRVGAVSKPASSEIISLGITDNGNPIVEPISVDWFKSDGRNLEESTIPLDTPGGRQLKIEAVSTGNVSADTHIEVIFLVEKAECI